MDNITKFYPKDAASSPDAVLEQAVGQYENVLIIGYDKDGCFEIRADLGLDHKEMLWMVEMFKHKLLHGDYSEED